MKTKKQQAERLKASIALSIWEKIGGKGVKVKYPIKLVTKKYAYRKYFELSLEDLEKALKYEK